MLLTVEKRRIFRISNDAFEIVSANGFSAQGDAPVGSIPPLPGLPTDLEWKARATVSLRPGRLAAESNLQEVRTVGLNQVVSMKKWSNSIGHSLRTWYVLSLQGRA